MIESKEALRELLHDEEFVRLGSDRYYILATSSYADDRTKVLNFGDTFAIFDRWGDNKQLGQGVQGIYHEGTRFISDTEFRINGYRPLLLSSNIKIENEIFSIDLTNPRIELDEGRILEKGVIHIGRSKFLQEGACYESIVLYNHDIRSHVLETSFFFRSDFRDIFEVRGMKREKRGTILPPETNAEGHLKLAYEGLDGISRTAWIRFETHMEWVEGSSVIFPVRLEPGERVEIRYAIHLQVGDNVVVPDPYSVALDKVMVGLQEGKKSIAAIDTDNEQFSNWLDRSKFDLLSVLRQTEHGPYPYAGVPWYNTPFGRDGIITALETLWIAPQIGKGVLSFLAANQATAHDPFRDAEPGKILHEARGGEMAELNEVPFKQYYGTIDATPLFISLAGNYYKRTADLDTIRSIWPNVMLALDWIEKYGDIDGDGFVEYKQKMESGLLNQGWKDSHDCISHEDGRLAEPSIALCEVQGYVYDAYRQAAYLAEALGDNTRAHTLESKAETLKTHFNEVFWDEPMQMYVLALDGQKKPCRVKTSNAGQCLFTGIVPPDRAARMVKALMQPDMFSGWGLRTLSSEARRYNPMSYHNGSVWPHDTALVAAGMARYGYMKECMQLMEGLYNACLFIDLQRLPELFCGFPFRYGEAPTSYPVACVPQAWSVAAVFLLLQSCLQITVDAPQKKLIFNNPLLPDYLKQVTLRNLKVPGGVFEVEFARHRRDVGINTICKPEGWQVVIYQ
jgi:glycogen debranching enzyme